MKERSIPRSSGSSSGDGSPQIGGHRRTTARRSTIFVAGTIDLTVQGELEQVNSVTATASLFPALGVTPWLGRAFTPEEDRPGAPHVVVLSHDY
jgi:hypothetical protein